VLAGGQLGGVEVAAGLESIARIASQTRFGNRPLLDGSSGISGEAQGEGLTYVSSTQRTRSSGISGYPVVLTQAPAQATLRGATPVTDKTVKNLSISLFEGGKSVQVVATPEDSPGSYFGRIKAAIEQNGLAVDVRQMPDGTLQVRHKSYGSKPTFQASSSVAGVLSTEKGVLESAKPGKDIQGTIGGEQAVGEGELLRGLPGNDNTDGLVVSYAGTPGQPMEGPGEDGARRDRQIRTRFIGIVNVANNSLDFQIGPNAGQRVTVAMPAMSPRYLARQVETESGFRNLAEISVTGARKAQDSIKVVDAAIDELTLARGQLGAFAKSGFLQETRSAAVEYPPYSCARRSGAPYRCLQGYPAATRIHSGQRTSARVRSSRHRTPSSRFSANSKPWRA